MLLPVRRPRRRLVRPRRDPADAAAAARLGRRAAAGRCDWLAIVWVGASAALLAPARRPAAGGSALGDRQAARLGAAAAHAAQPAGAHRPVPVDRRAESSNAAAEQGVLRDPSSGRDHANRQGARHGVRSGCRRHRLDRRPERVVTAAHVVAGENDTGCGSPASTSRRWRRRPARRPQRRRRAPRRRRRPRRRCSSRTRSPARRSRSSAIRSTAG